MMFTIEFFRIRKEDNARAMLDRITHIASDLESAKVKAMDTEDGGFLETRMVRIAFRHSLCARLFSAQLVHTYFIPGAQKLRSRHGRKN